MTKRQYRVPSGHDVDGTRPRVAHSRPDPVSLQGGDGNGQHGVKLAGEASELDQEPGGGQDDGAESNHDQRLHLGDVGGGVADGGVEFQASLGLEVRNPVGDEHELDMVEVLEVRNWLSLFPPGLSSEKISDLGHVEHRELGDATRDLVVK